MEKSSLRHSAAVLVPFPLLALLFVLSAFRGLTGSLPAPDERVTLTVVDPLIKVLREVGYFPSTEPRADVARGETATFQLVVRGDARVRDLRTEVGPMRQGQVTLPSAKVGYVGYVRVERSTPTPSRDRIPSASGFYPDPILPNPPATIAPNTSQPIWISIPVPKEAMPGVYAGTVTVKGTVGDEAFSVELALAVHVYVPVVDKTSLWVTNWFGMGDRQLAMVNGGVPVEPYSERYWELTRELARVMAAYRQNVVLLSPLRLAAYRMAAGTLEIDFRHFDRAVEIFREEGAIGRIEGGHIGGRESHWTSPFVVYVPEVSGDTVTWSSLPISDPKASAFYSRFIPALVSHLEEKGWKDIYMQHIADEPIGENVESYIEISRFVETLWPDVRIIEAVHSRDVADVMDVWVPQLNFAHDDYDFYRERQGRGDEFWFYTCLAPQGEYANRFIELPLLKTRLLHWINYRFGLTGYLHWGLNYWSGDPFAETTGVITESGNVLPGGDAWIVYPGDGTFLSSIRLEAMRDGIVDYELLSRLRQVHPEETDELARQVVYRFDLYDMGVEDFRAKRRRLLEELSSAQ